MMRLPDVAEEIAVVIPCYNEELRFDGDAFIEFSKRNPNVSFLFVNDGSRDKTLAVLQQAAAALPSNLSTLDLKENGGKAEAVRQGVLHLLNIGTRAKYIGYFDADLATPLEEIPYMLTVAQCHGDHLAIFGARLLRNGALIDRKWQRHYISRIFVTLRELFFPFRVYDSQCGAKLVKSAVARDLFQEPFVSDWLFDVELLIRIRHRTSKKEAWHAVIEVPLRVWFEVGTSKVTFRNLLSQPWELIRIRHHYHSRI